MTQQKMPTVWNYGEYSTDNYGANSLAVDIPRQSKNKLGITLYYSYKTIIAFYQDGKLFISKNIWGTTTGKHLNWIDNDQSKRIDYEQFSKELAKALRKI